VGREAVFAVGVEVKHPPAQGDRIGRILLRADPITLTLDAARLDLSRARE
jgi:hypothetical protein